MTVNRKDLATGAVFIAFGLFYGGIAYQHLPIGKALNMGPGYFPVILSGCMVVIGAVIAIRSFVVPQLERFGVVPWRAVVMLTLSTVIFAAFLEQLGLFPAILVTSLVASLASSEIKWWKALIVSTVMAAFCVVVFHYGIRLPVSVFGSWFGG